MFVIGGRVEPMNECFQMKCVRGSAMLSTGRVEQASFRQSKGSNKMMNKKFRI